MKLLKDEKGQLHTIEGLAAALLMISTVFFVTQGVTVITPQTGLSLDVQLKQSGADALMVLDTEVMIWDMEYQKDVILLKKYVAAWNGTEANITYPVPDSIDVNFPLGNAGGNGLNHSLYVLLPEDVVYNVDFVYENNGNLRTSPVIMKGYPPDDSIAVSQLVTLHNDDNICSPQLNTTDLNVKVVEVRLILWHV